MKKFIFPVLCLVLICSCTQKNYNTLVLGSAQFNGVFSPFFSTSGYDSQVVGLVNASLITNDRNGVPTDGITKYRQPEEIFINGEKYTIYTFELFDQVQFSDGTIVTADDIIFTYKVLCDPFYDGASTILTTPILGVNEYYYDDPNYQNVLSEIANFMASFIPEKEALQKVAQDLSKKYELGLEFFIEGGEYFESHTKVSAYENKQKELEREYIKKNLSSNTVYVNEIEGIKKINEKVVQITIKGVDPKAIWNLGGVQIVSAAYYDNNFKKGDLSKIKAKNAHPFGAGPYKFVKYENNVVSLEKNSYYYLGEPFIDKIKIQVSSAANKLDAIKLGKIDISDVSATPDMLKLTKEADLHYDLIDNLGYGYIGINAKRISDVNIRRGLMSLMNRAPAVRTYYGELASVIERPMSKVSWAYPDQAPAVYDFNVQKALTFFKQAGYQQINNKLVKDGKQLSVEIGISGDGTMDHPAAPILTQMKDELEKIGGILNINDTDGNVLFDRLTNGQWDMWVAAWQATLDPDMYQIYHSNGPSNHYNIKNTELDRLIVEARQTLDIEERQKKYFRCLDIIMEEAVEMPVYQRKNMNVFNPQMLDITTLPLNMTPFFGYGSEIQNLKMLEE
ncbi:MAG: ABC transporter substrate-binding protein [Treponemataceae bacterium]